MERKKQQNRTDSKIEVKTTEQIYRREYPKYKVPFNDTAYEIRSNRSPYTQILLVYKPKGMLNNP